MRIGIIMLNVWMGKEGAYLIWARINELGRWLKRIIKGSRRCFGHAIRCAKLNICPRQVGLNTELSNSWSAAYAYNCYKIS